MNHKIYRIVGILALACNMVLLGYFFSQRSSYHIDEVFSYGHANSTQGAFLFDPLHTSSVNKVWNQYLFNRWLPGKVYHNYLTVQPADTFNYKHIYKNMAVDVHPPLFLILLHTVCSFTPDVMSKWQGAVLQLLLWPFVLLLLFKLSRLFLEDEFEAWAVVLFYAYSRAGLETVVFIRMYLLQTLFALGLVYGVSWMIKYKKATKKLWLWIGVMASLGMLTQYNSILFAGLVTLWGSGILLATKQTKLAFQLMAVMLVSLGISLLVFPATVHILLTSQRSHEAFANLLSISQLGWHAKILANDFLTYLWSIHLPGWILPYVVLGVVVVYSSIYIRSSRPLAKLLGLILAMGVCLNMLMPYMYIFNTRYYMMLIPFFALISLGYMMHLIRYVGKKLSTVYFRFIVVGLIVLNSVLVNFLYTSPYAFAGNVDATRVLHGKQVVMWVPNPSMVYEFAQVLRNAGQIKIGPVARFREELQQDLEGADYLVVLNRDASESYLMPSYKPVLFNHPDWIRHIGEEIAQQVRFVQTVKVGSCFYDIYRVLPSKGNS